MPSVTVTLTYTPRPDGNTVPLSISGNIETVHLTGDGAIRVTDHRNGGIELERDEVMPLIQALAEVLGCTEDRWRGIHWKAHERNGHELAATPLGQWYTNREDCRQAVRTLFGYGTRVVLNYGDDCGELLRSADDYPTTTCPGSSECIDDDCPACYPIPAPATPAEPPANLAVDTTTDGDESP